MLYIEPNIKSFYQGKSYGATLYRLVVSYRPQRVIEFGSGLGFTTKIICDALDEIGQGHLTSYDNSLNPRKFLRLCWNTRHCARLTLRYGNLDRWLDQPSDFDLLYVDVHNTGATISKLKGLDGIVLFEGGSQARDEHMRGKPPINGSARYTIHDPTFPSLSQMDE